MNLSRSSAALGTFLLCGGIAVMLLLGIHLLKQSVNDRVARAADYLTIPGTPEFVFPPPTMTPIPPTPVVPPPPTPTSPPVRMPPVRVVMPSIDLNSNIVQVQPEELVNTTGDVRWRWAAAEYAVGHHLGSGYPGSGTNIVLSGHNNARGKVFENLPDLKIGDEVVVYTADEEFRYRVQYKRIVKYRGIEAQAERTLQGFSRPTDFEQLTMFSCYPYATNRDRIVVIAVPPDQYIE